jgi:hypothetical protein
MAREMVMALMIANLIMLGIFELVVSNRLFLSFFFFEGSNLGVPDFWGEEDEERNRRLLSCLLSV